MHQNKERWFRIHQEEAHWLTTPKTLLQCDTKGTWQNSPKQSTEQAVLLHKLIRTTSTPWQQTWQWLMQKVAAISCTWRWAKVTNSHQTSQSRLKKERETERSGKRNPSSSQGNAGETREQDSERRIPDCIDGLRPNRFGDTRTS